MSASSSLLAAAGWLPGSGISVRRSSSAEALEAGPASGAQQLPGWLPSCPGKTDARGGGPAARRLTAIRLRCLAGAAAYCALTGTTLLVGFALLWLLLIPSWMLAEVVFCAWWVRKYLQLNAQPRPHHRPPGVSFDEMYSIFRRFTDGKERMAYYLNIEEM